jgi:hypothetical protein
MWDNISPGEYRGHQIDARYTASAVRESGQRVLLAADEAGRPLFATLSVVARRRAQNQTPQILLLSTGGNCDMDIT